MRVAGLKVPQGMGEKFRRDPREGGNRAPSEHSGGQPDPMQTSVSYWGSKDALRQASPTTRGFTQGHASEKSSNYKGKNPGRSGGQHAGRPGGQDRSQGGYAGGSSAGRGPRSPGGQGNQGSGQRRDEDSQAGVHHGSGFAGGAGGDKPRSGQRFGKKGPGQGPSRGGPGQNRGPGGRPAAKFGKKFTKS